MVEVNSRAKGARVERKFRDQLRDEGFEARRGQQYAGGTDSPDVICPALPTIHWEVKGVEREAIRKWMTQAIEDAGDKVPVVASKKSREDWLVTLRFSDFIKIVKETDLVVDR